MKKAAGWFTALVLVSGMLLLSTGCDRYYGGGYVYEPRQAPPPWAPAHGRRAKYRYRYYPDVAVYYDIERRVYFYVSGGVWRTSAGLPATIRISGSYVHLEMDVDKPYKFHKDVVKKYPPGKQKKREKERGKGKGREDYY